MYIILRRIIGRFCYQTANIIPPYNINKLIMRVLIIVAYYTMNMYFALSQMPPVSTTLEKIIKKTTLF